MTYVAQYLGLFLDGTVNPWLSFIAIILASFVLEDAAAILSAMAVADGHISTALALGSLFVGIALGDLGLYAVGKLAATHPWARRFVATDRARGMQGWLDKRLISAVISVRFLPGARLPTYTACGFLGVSFLRFAFAVIVATLVWTTFLFTVALWAGSVIMTHFGAWRWPIGIALAVVVLGGGQILARRQARRSDAKGPTE
ncbi:MAG: VTT domain-containing protein [Paracoccaceae bacterium]|jgi:membrane protein DedA with SNARE-associated domain|nr:VTT domain-containing protein [Paracoccaceae bacterium]